MAKFSMGLVCLGAAALISGYVSDASAGDTAVRVSAFLCDSAPHAMQFADVKAQGEIDEMAKDQVGRLAKAEVCGRYAGTATIESEAVTLKGGVAYKVTAFRFTEDHKIAWMAELSFAPPKPDWSL